MNNKSTEYRLDSKTLKVIKYRKQNTKFSHPPKKKFVHFLPKPLKVVDSKRLKLFIVLNSP